MVYVFRERDDDRDRDRSSSLLDDGYSSEYVEQTSYSVSNTPADLEYTPPPLLDAVEGGDSESLAQIANQMGLNYIDLGEDITQVAIVDGLDSTESIPQLMNNVSALSGLVNLETGKLLISVERGKTYGWVEGDISNLHSYMGHLEQLGHGRDSQDPYFNLYEVDIPSPPSFFKEPGLTLVDNSSEPEPLDSSSTATSSGSSEPEKGIVVTSETNVAVPGTTMTYEVTEANRKEDYSYHWQVINDLSAIPKDERDGFFERMKYPAQINLGIEYDGEIEAEWDFPGRHTIELEIYNHQGQLQSVHYYRQTVQNAAEQAGAAFESSPPPIMQSDVYLTWLSAQRELARENGAENEQLQQIDEAIANATELLGVSEDNPTGEAIPVSATLVPTAEPIAAPLQLYLKPIPGGWAIVDLTNPDPAQARTYEGKIPTGRRQERRVPEAERSGLALTRAWLNFVRNNPHPAGEIVADFPQNLAGENYRKQGYSDGESTLGKVRNWFSGIGLVAGLGGLALTVATGGVGTVAVGLFLAASASGVVAGGSNIADRVQHGNFEWDGETALDIIDIAGGLAGGTTTVLSLGGKAANIGRLRNAMLIGEAVETGSDVAGGVILGAQYLAQIEEIKSDLNLTEEQKKEAIAEVLKAAAATGGMMVLGTAVSVNNSRRTGGSDTDVDVDAPDTSSGRSNAPDTTSTDTATPTTEVEADTTQTTTNNVPDTSTDTATPTTEVEADTTQTTTNNVPDTATPTTEVEADTTAPTPQTTTPDVVNTTPDITSLVNALPEDLRSVVDITVDSSLNGSTVRVYYQPEIHIRVGATATATDISLHVPTVRTLRRYSGLTGKVRALIERITNWIKQNGEPPFGSVAWEAKLELEKLPRILAAKQAVLASNSTDAATRARIEADIADLESQIDYHTRNLDAMDTDPGRGFIAAENTPSPKTAKEARGLLTTQVTTVRAKLETRIAEVNQGIYDLQARLDNLDVEFENRNAEFEARIKALEPELNNDKKKEAAENLIDEIEIEQEHLSELKTQEREELYRAINELKLYQSDLKEEVQPEAKDNLDFADMGLNEIEATINNPSEQLKSYKEFIEDIEIQNNRIEQSRDIFLEDANFKARAIAYGENSYEPITSLPPQAHSRQKMFLRLADRKEYVIDSLGQKVPRKIFRNITGADDRNLKRQKDMVATGAGLRNKPLTHAMGTKPSAWISTTKAETIVNPKGRPFEGKEGKVEIDLVGIDPSKIVDLSTDKAQKNHEFAELSDELTPGGQATRDVVRTEEVLIKDNIPSHLVTRVDNSK